MADKEKSSDDRHPWEDEWRELSERTEKQASDLRRLRAEQENDLRVERNIGLGWSGNGSPRPMKRGVAKD